MKINNKWVILFVLALVNFTHIVDSMIVMPLGEIFIKEFGITTSQYSALVSAYALSATFSGILGIFFLDRFDRTKALLVLYTGFALGTLLCGWAETYTLLITMRILTGFFGGMIGALVLSLVSDLFKFTERGTALGYLFAAFSAASAFGVPLGIYLADLSTWHLPFIIIGMLGLCISLFIFIYFPPFEDHKLSIQTSNASQPLKSILRDRNQVNALIAGFVLVLAHFMIIPFISPYVIRNVGLSQSQVALQFFLGGFFTLFTAPYVGKMTDKHGVMKVFTIMMLSSFVPTLVITNLPKVSIYIALTFTSLFFVFASGRMISPNTVLTAAAPVSNRGSFMSLKSSLQQLAIAMAGFISGHLIYINEEGLYARYWLVGLISISLGIISLVWVKKVRVAVGN